MVPFFATILASVVVSSILRLFLRGSLPVRKRGGVLIGVLLICVGLFVGYVASRHVTRGRAQKDWPIVQGIVISSTISGEHSFSPLIVYQYIVDKATLVGESHLRVPMFGGKRKTMEVASAHVAVYHPNDTVSVSYNPIEPSESTLTPGPVWSDYGQLGASWFILLIGLLMIMLPTKSYSDPAKS